MELDILIAKGKQKSQRRQPKHSRLLADADKSPHLQPRSRLVKFRFSAAELENMKKTAKILDLTLSGYIRSLHATVRDKLRKGGR